MCSWRGKQSACLLNAKESDIALELDSCQFANCDSTRRQQEEACIQQRHLCPADAYVMLYLICTVLLSLAIARKGYWEVKAKLIAHSAIVQAQKSR